MNYVGIESIKNAYRDLLQEQNRYQEASSLELKEFTDPIFDGYQVHPEDTPSLTDINNALQQISVDLVALTSQYSSAAQRYNDLAEEIVSNLAAVDEIIETEKERIQDINIIAGNISAFTSVKTLKATDLSGTCSTEDDYTFMCAATDRVSTRLTVQDVFGNGYEGNAYVYNDNIFEVSAVNTSQRSNMIDYYSTTCYEYSRLTSAVKNDMYPVDVNYDDKEAECSIVLTSPTSTFNFLRIQSDITNISVEQISTSEDGGLSFKDLLTKSVEILNPSKKYEDDTYIYGSGILNFPTTNAVKIKLKSNGVTADNLAFARTVLDNVIFLKDIVFDINSYVSDYLFPIFFSQSINNVYTVTEADDTAEATTCSCPVSLLIAVSLLRTRNKPAAVGAFNFWDLDYTVFKDIEDITVEEDTKKAAFYNRRDSCNAILKVVGANDDIIDLLKEYDSLAEKTVDSLATLGYQILTKLTGTSDITTYDKLKDILLTYSLTDYDTATPSSKTEEQYQQYERYFVRLDQQQDNYEQSLKDATTIMPLTGVKRHLIRVNEITAFKGSFTTTSYLETGELLPGAVDCIAIFANEYIPPTFPADRSTIGNQKYLSYYLTVNEKTFEIVPVNSHKAGIKIIRFSNYTVAEDYTKHISEPIKSAKLKVKFYTPDTSCTPYLSKLKVCLGKAVIQP